MSPAPTRRGSNLQTAQILSRGYRQALSPALTKSSGAILARSVPGPVSTQRIKKDTAEAPLLARDAPQCLVLKDMLKKRLGEILRVVRRAE